MIEEIRPPDGFDWAHWVARWEQMQARYLVQRPERFATLVRVAQDAHTCPASGAARGGSVSRVLDLGCGPGSLMLVLLEAFPEAEVYGLDFDPTMLLLARARLAQYGARAHVCLADLRTASWAEALPGAADVVVSATALHWLTTKELAALYRQVAGLLRPGGVFLNADHVGSAYVPIQKGWERHRQAMRAQERAAGEPGADDWDGFWDGYARALGVDIEAIHGRMLGGWEGGVEEGLPLAWHLDELRRCGFRAVDCFWRCDCDAIYGGICT